MLLYYRGKRRYFSVVCRVIFRTMFYSRKRLVSLISDYINDQLNNKNEIADITYSGRVALNTVFLMPDIRNIILPDYICNVVPMAAENKNILYYSIDENYQIDFDSIIRIISKCEGCCVLFPSYLNRICDINNTIGLIRHYNTNCKIVFDECQNFDSIKNLPVLDSDTFIIYSFNNKMTYGFLGGLVIQKKGGKIKQQEIHTFNLIDEIHGAYVLIRTMVADLVKASVHKFSIPEDPEISHGIGIYGIHNRRCLKVSLAAASLIKNNIKWYSICLQHNMKIAELLDKKGIISIIPGFNVTYTPMPYLPISIDKKLYGNIPLKGSYGCLSKSMYIRNQCFILNNIMMLEIKE